MTESGIYEQVAKAFKEYGWMKESAAAEGRAGREISDTDDAGALEEAVKRLEEKFALMERRIGELTDRVTKLEGRQETGN